MTDEFLERLAAALREAIEEVRAPIINQLTSRACPTIEAHRYGVGQLDALSMIDDLFKQAVARTRARFLSDHL